MTDVADKFATAMAACPLVAILRGLTPDDATPVAEEILSSGWTIIEVPLGSPHALDSISKLASEFPMALIGAGTVTRPEQVDVAYSAGARLVVSPNFNWRVVARARQLKMACLPGVGTLTEAFEAIDQGASGLKLFPAEAISPVVVKAFKTVMPAGTMLLPVGGISVDNVKAYFNAGADGVGVGGALYRPGCSLSEIRRVARAFVDSVERLDV